MSEADSLKATLAVESGYFSADTLKLLTGAGLGIVPVRTPADLGKHPCAVLCLTPGLLTARRTREHWQQAARDALLVVDETLAQPGDTRVSKQWPAAAIVNTLALAATMAGQRRQLQQLADVGSALSSERDHQTLLEMILREARRLAGCDAATIFLIEKRGDGEPELVIRLAQNESVKFDFHEQRLALDTHSLAGYVAVSGEEVNLADIYRAPAGAPWKFNSAFDRQIGYRTTSVYAVPLRVPRGEIIGGIEFINRKRNPAARLTNPETTPAEVLPFTNDVVPLLRALASQAAVAIENNRLLAAIEDMFEGFVVASVTAIEQRDPTTSGHSFRVARFTTGLAEALPRSGVARFREARFGERQLRELRYAALLHDFGKIGVREHVLVKAHKLSEQHYLAIRERINLERERLKRRALAQQLSLVRGNRGNGEALRAVEQELAQRLAQLDAYWNAIQEANEPNVLHKEVGETLGHVTGYRLTEEETPLLNEDEYRILAIPRGSLTDDERREIESHVVHTYNFLRRIPWPEELAGIPEIAGAHHEKLDGSGYPQGRREPEIPFPSRLMTVADIYDALTAADRPYKKSMPAERALAILEDEAKHGKLDGDLVKIFTEARVFTLTPEV